MGVAAGVRSGTVASQDGPAMGVPRGLRRGVGVSA